MTQHNRQPRPLQRPLHAAARSHPALPLLCLLLLAGCASAPPKQADNLCSVFKERPEWLTATQDTQTRWGTPIPLQMAIVRHESSFNGDAKPAREYLLGVIPWFRPSSAYGYAQAKDETWEWYRNKTGNDWADRDDFEDAVDFIGWYTNQTTSRLGIAKSDAYNQYLAYHEGQGGYRKGTYKQKAWLLNYARRVERTTGRYTGQLQACRGELESSRSWWRF